MRDGEGAHDRAHRLAAARGRDDVGDDGVGERRGRAAEGAGDDARPGQRRQPAREAAGERAAHEADHGDGQRFSAIVAIEEEAAEKAGDGGGLPVAGDDLAELGHRNVQRACEVGAERHHHREVEHVDELHGTDEEHDAALGHVEHSRAHCKMLLMTSQDWLQDFLRAHGGVAGTVHRVVAADMMELDAHVNIPPPVQAATRQIPVGKGMAGMAMAENRAVSTCNVREDQSGAVEPGAKAVGAGAGVAFPVHDSAGNVRAVIGIAWKEERELGTDELCALQQAGEGMP